MLLAAFAIIPFCCDSNGLRQAGAGFTALMMGAVFSKGSDEQARVIQALLDAGGAGGLLAVAQTNGVFLPSYDANANITGYTDIIGAAARYEYLPFGETIAAFGALAESSKFRFSTKYYERESKAGLYYNTASISIRRVWAGG